MKTWGRPARKVCGLLFTFVSSALFPAAASAGTSVWKAEIDPGRAAFDRRDYPRAERSAVAGRSDRAGLGLRVDTLLCSGNDCVNRGKYREAIPLYRRALEIQEHLLRSRDASTANCLRALATAYVDQEEYALASPLYRRALPIFRRCSGAESLDVCTCLYPLGVIALERKRYAEAERIFRRALPMAEKAGEAGRLDQALCLQDLGHVYSEERRYLRTEPFYRQALALLERLPGPENDYLASAVLSVGANCLDQGRYNEAEPYLLRALAIRKRLWGPNDHKTALCQGFYSDLLQAKQRQAAAAALSADGDPDAPLAGVWIRLLLLPMVLAMAKILAPRVADLWVRGEDGVSR